MSARLHTRLSARLLVRLPARHARHLLPGSAALALLLSAVAPARAQGGGQPGCSDEAYRQFDFWVGKWEVTNPAGRVVGSNRITPILGGCVLLEEWQSAGQHSGKSFNIYDAARSVWHQTWVDTSGLLLELEGGLEGESMVLQGTRPGPDGEVLHRITWRPLDGGDVRQTWDTSTDGGASWSSQFNGLYSRKE